MMGSQIYVPNYILGYAEQIKKKVSHSTCHKICKKIPLMPLVFAFNSVFCFLKTTSTFLNLCVLLIVLLFFENINTLEVLFRYTVNQGLYCFLMIQQDFQTVGLKCYSHCTIPRYIESGWLKAVDDRLGQDGRCLCGFYLNLLFVFSILSFKNSLCTVHDTLFEKECLNKSFGILLYGVFCSMSTKAC